MILQLILWTKSLKHRLFTAGKTSKYSNLIPLLQAARELKPSKLHVLPDFKVNTRVIRTRSSLICLTQPKLFLSATSQRVSIFLGSAKDKKQWLTVQVIKRSLDDIYRHGWPDHVFHISPVKLVKWQQKIFKERKWKKFPMLVQAQVSNDLLFQRPILFVLKT